MTSDHKFQSDQATGSSDTSKARKGVDLINQQMKGAGEINSDTLRLSDQAARSGDTNKERQGVDLINQRLQGASETNSDTLLLTDQATSPSDTNKVSEGVKETGRRLQEATQLNSDTQNESNREDVNNSDTFAELNPRLKGKSVEEVKTEINKAMNQFEYTKTGKKIEALLAEQKPKLTLLDLVERPRAEIQGYGRFTSVLATLAEDGGCRPHETGTFIHRIMELRAMAEHPDEVARGERLLEQHIHSSEGNKRLDYVICRNETHFIGDYKPINLADFVESKEGVEYKTWLETNVGNGYPDRLREGQHFLKQLPPEIQQSLREFMRSTTEKHKSQLEVYGRIYAKSADLPPSKVRVGVHPYFVYRP